jgi:hypothetical protein
MDKAVSVFSYSNSADVSQWQTKDLSLIVRMLSNGFCVCVLSGDKTVLYLEQYAFSGGLPLEEKFGEMENACKKMGIACGKSVFQYYTNSNTQIPEEYYVENLNNAIADLLAADAKEYVPVAEKIDGWKLYNLSLWNKELREKVNEKFPNFQLKTVLGALLEKTAARQPKEEAFVFVEDNHFTIIAANEKGLLAANSFAFENESDFLYYSLAFLRKFYQNTNAISVFLCGNIVKESPLFLSMNKYISDLKLMKCESENGSIENSHYYGDIV